MNLRKAEHLLYKRSFLKYLRRNAWSKAFISSIQVEITNRLREKNEGFTCRSHDARSISVSLCSEAPPLRLLSASASLGLDWEQPGSRERVHQ
ncbi:hypothetical protein RRG08_030756 [Elysia crispata]|uniref:Uncharacterized protein n=1 Tax=Elysia crispata TaxID=231223 RepID=A0AAE1CXS6_9GAST|nr:hypothetical protein RRG08_030756 [Elysia crispata]